MVFRGTKHCKNKCSHIYRKHTWCTVHTGSNGVRGKRRKEEGVCARASVCVCVRARERAYMRAYARVCVQTSLCLSPCPSVRLSLCLCVCVCLSVSVSVYKQDSGSISSLAWTISNTPILLPCKATTAEMKGSLSLLQPIRGKRQRGGTERTV